MCTKSSLSPYAACLSVYLSWQGSRRFPAPAMRNSVALVVSLCMVLAGLGSCRSDGRLDEGPAMDRDKLIQDLRAAGSAIETVGEISQPFFSVKGMIIKVDGADVQVFQYPDVSTARAEARKVSPDGSTVGRTRIGWVAPPHFYRKGRLIVVYVGNSLSVLKALQAVLGPQFAGK